MLTAKQTNTLYFSENLHTDPRFSATCKALMGILDKHAIKYGFLAGTKDIWCRDYMPIQVELGKLVQFRYEPSYLEGDLDLQSDPKAICLANDLQPQFSKINPSKTFLGEKIITS